MPIKLDKNNPSLTESTSETNTYGDLIIDFTILFPTKLDTQRIDLLKKIFNHKENENENETALVGYYYKDKEDIVKEIMNDQQDLEEEGVGCIQQ